MRIKVASNDLSASTAKYSTIPREGSFHGVMANTLDGDIVISDVKALDCRIMVGSNPSRTITFTCGQIPLGKV